MKNFERYHKAVAFIDSLTNLPIFPDYMSVETVDPKIYLDRMNYFLKLLGNPQKSFKYIHITGTSGKGTVATMVANCLTSAGRKTGLFTSPFVVTPIEKIQVGRDYIAPNEFADIVQYLKPFITSASIESPFGRPSNFEIYFAIALLYFKKKKCEWAVLEVGCGGRFDATNVIENPVVTAITSIDLGHTEILGKTLESIAFDKAGIIKQGSKFFTAEQRPGILKIFKKICDTEGVVMEAVAGTNTALAQTIASAVGLEKKYIEKGLKETRLPARFEIVAHRPLTIIDGAHNPAKIKYAIDNLQKQKFKKLVLIVGICANKDTVSILEQIIPLADEVIFTRAASRDRKPAPPQRLLAESKRYLKQGASTAIFLDSVDAFAHAKKLAGANDCILVTGSFYLVGELRTLWFPEIQILKNRRSFFI